MEKHLAIYYIATSNYKEGFIHFKKNIPYLYPEMKKTVIILSDGLTEWNNIIEENITYKVYHIDHFCWPIVTLFKMKYILDHKIDCDYAMYMNADLQYNINYDTSLNKIDLNKLNVSRHTHSDMNKCFDGNYFEKIDKTSSAYIGRPYTYIQGGLFIGPSDIFFKMCKEVCDMLEIDLKSNIITQWHDESYLNKWCVEHICLVKKDQMLMSYRKFIKDIPFAIINTYVKDRSV